MLKPKWKVKRAVVLALVAIKLMLLVLSKILLVGVEDSGAICPVPAAFFLRTIVVLGWVRRQSAIGR